MFDQRPWSVRAIEAVSICLKACDIKIPAFEVDDVDNFVAIPDLGVYLSYNATKGPCTFTKPIEEWTVSHEVYYPATRWDPGDADIRDVSTHATLNDAAVALVTLVLQDRMNSALMSEDLSRVAQDYVDAT